MTRVVGIAALVLLALGAYYWDSAPTTGVWFLAGAMGLGAYWAWRTD